MHPHADPIKIGISIFWFFRDNPIVLCLLLFPLTRRGFLCQKEEWYLSELKTCTTAEEKKNHIHPDVIFKKHVLQFFLAKQREVGSNILKLCTFLSYIALLALPCIFWMCVWILAGHVLFFRFPQLSSHLVHFLWHFPITVATVPASKFNSEYTEHGSLFWKATI